MNKEKEIKEIASVMCSDCRKTAPNCKHEICDSVLESATATYDADYRKQEWIGVAERLPDNHRRVLIACKGTTIGGAAPIAIGSYGGGFWSIADADGTAYLTKYMHVVVTHWMELPDIPRGEENG